MTEKEKMLEGQLYDASDKQLVLERTHARKVTRQFNESEDENKNEILKKLFACTGEKLYIEPNFRCDYGNNIYIGDNFYANFDCIILDVCKVAIGKNCMFG